MNSLHMTKNMVAIAGFFFLAASIMGISTAFIQNPSIETIGLISIINSICTLAGSIFLILAGVSGIKKNKEI